MNDIVGEFATIAQNPLQRAKKWKEAGGRVIGCFPMYIPEEIIHASGILPITLLGTNETVTLSDRYLQPYLCHVPRSNLDLALKGKLDFLDGIVFPDICDVVRMLPNIWNLHHPMPFQHTIVVAGKINSVSSRRYLANRFNVPRPARWEFSIGHDGGIRIFVDGSIVLTEPETRNPACPDRTQIEIPLDRGEHEIVIAFDTAAGKGWGIFSSWVVPKSERKANTEHVFPVLL